MSLAPVACTDSESWWRAHLERQPRSGLSVCRYCVREGFSQASFYNWRKRLCSSPAESSGFPELTPLLSGASPAGARSWEMLTVPTFQNSGRHFKMQDSTPCTPSQ